MDEDRYNTMWGRGWWEYRKPLVRRRKTVGLEHRISQPMQIVQLDLSQAWEGYGALELANEKSVLGLPQRVPLPIAKILGFVVENISHWVLVMNSSQHQVFRSGVEANKSMDTLDSF